MLQSMTLLVFYPFCSLFFDRAVRGMQLKPTGNSFLRVVYRFSPAVSKESAHGPTPTVASQHYERSTSASRLDELSTLKV